MGSFLVPFWGSFLSAATGVENAVKPIASTKNLSYLN